MARRGGDIIPEGTFRPSFAWYWTTFVVVFVSCVLLWQYMGDNDPAAQHVHTVARVTTTEPPTTTSTTEPPRPTQAAPVHPPTTHASRSRPPAPLVASGDVWSALARCESGGNPRAVGGGGRYFGAFQFSLGTWHSMGRSGNPIDYSYEDQLATAKKLVARAGWGQFPHCSRALGLR